MKRRALIALLPLLALPAPGFGGAQITHHTIRAEIDPHRSRLAVTDQFTLEGYETSEVHFLLHKGLKIGALSMDGRNLHWSESEYRPDRGGEGEEAEERDRGDVAGGDGQPERPRRRAGGAGHRVRRCRARLASGAEGRRTLGPSRRRAD